MVKRTLFDVNESDNLNMLSMLGWAQALDAAKRVHDTPEVGRWNQRGFLPVVPDGKGGYCYLPEER